MPKLRVVFYSFLFLFSLWGLNNLTGKQFGIDFNILAKNNLLKFTYQDSTDLDTFNYQIEEPEFSDSNLMYPDSTSIGFVTETVPELLQNAVVRLSNKAIAKITYSKPELVTNLVVLDSLLNPTTLNFTIGDSSIFIKNLSLNSIYYVVVNHNLQNEFFLAIVNTHNQEGMPLYLSKEFVRHIENWQANEIVDEVEQSFLVNYIDSIDGLDIVEKLYFFQRFIGDSSQILFDNYIDANGNPFDLTEFIEDGYSSGKILNFNAVPVEKFNPNNLDPCRCNYIMEISFNISPGTANYVLKRNDPFIQNHPREHLGGDNVFRHLHEKKNGPAKDIRYEVKSEGFGKGTITGEEGGFASNPKSGLQKADLYWNLACTKNILGQPNALPASCACSKELTLHWKYDTEVLAEAQKFTCYTCNEKKSEALAQDAAIVWLEIAGQDPRVLDANSIVAKANCNAPGALQYFSLWSDFVVKTSEALVSVLSGGIVPVDTLAMAQQTFTNMLKLSESSVCGSAKRGATLFENSRTFTLQANKYIKITMFSDHLVSGSAKRAARSISNIKSSYALAGTISENFTQNEIKYCCMKKVGAHHVGAFDGAPSNSVEIRNDFLGVNYARTGPWKYPYNDRNPNKWHAVIVPDEVNVIFGNSGCDNVPVEVNGGKMIFPEKEPLIKGAFINAENTLVVELNTSIDEVQNPNKLYTIQIFDVTGKLLFEKYNSPISQKEKYDIGTNFSSSVLFLRIFNHETSNVYKFISK